jgi:RimJ/RimL family protein N-acetyltransferase
MTAIIAAFAPRVVDAFGLYRLYATVYETNPVSMRVLEKSGFAHEGVHKSAVVKRGQLLDIHVYALTRRELKETQ